MDPFTVGLVGVAAALLYWYGTTGQGLFRRMGIPGPSPWPYIGNLFSFASNRRFLNFCELRQKYGKLYGIYLGYQPVVVIQDLDMLKQIMVKDFNNFSDRWIIVSNKRSAFSKNMFFMGGDHWRFLRNVVSPTFSGGKLRHMCGQINQCAELLKSNLLDKAERRQVVCTKSMFGDYTMDVIARTAFGLEVDSQKDPNNPFVCYAKRIFSRSFFSSPMMLLKAIFPMLSGVEFEVLGKDIRQFFTDVTVSTLEERKKSGQKRMDFLQLLMEAEADEVETTANGNVETTAANGKAETTTANGKTASGSKKRLTIDEIVGQSVLFFIAGYETTASTLNFLSHSVALQPHIQQKMYEEIMEVIGNDNPDYDNVHKLKYMEQVVLETLRMYPPATMVTRKAAQAYEVGGVKLEPGTAVGIPIYSIHHDPENYPDPEKFDPDRFDADARAVRHPMAFMPFGQGPRMCIGMRLALVEAKIALVHVIRAVRIVRCEETKVPLPLIDRAVLQPAEPVLVRVEAR